LEDISGGAAVSQIQQDQTNMLFKNNGSERMRIDSSGNVGIGTSVIPAYWSGYVALQLGVDNSIFSNSATGVDSALFIGQNIYNDGSNYKYTGASSNEGSLIDMRNGTFSFLNAPAGTGTATLTERMRIDSSGNVGIGQSSPSSFDVGARQLVVGDTSVASQGITIAADTNSILYFADGTSGDEAYRGSIIYNHTADMFAFRTAGFNERMRIDSSGQLFLGKTSGVSGAFFQVAGDASNQSIRMENAYGTGTAQLITNTSGQTFNAILFENSGVSGSISVTTSATAYNTSSDARLKDVTGEARGLEVINELNPVAYNWKADGKADEGLIAQEVLDIVPNAVSGSEEEMYQMDYSKLVVHLVAGMKEQQTIIDDLKTRIETLEG